MLFHSDETYCQDTLKKFDTKFVMGGGEQELLEEADYFFAFGEYDRALEKYRKLDARYPGTIEYKYRAGICCLFMGGMVDEAIKYLEDAKKVKPKLHEISFYLGRAYHLNYEFDKALIFYKEALEKKSTSEPNRIKIPRYLLQCENGKKLVVQPEDVEIANLGQVINSDAGEYAPVISADESILIYTYKGKKSTGGLLKLGEQWLDPEGIGPRINTKEHEATIGLSANGTQLFIYLGDNGGDIYVSNLVKNNWSAPEPVAGKINSRHWEGSASLSSDGKTLYFSSDRPGGLGGKDIYVSKIETDGQWDEPVNIGPVINTRFDEDAPFIHAVGTLLFFSSQGHNSMGGYDIFYSILSDTAWTDPVNIGHPVNTPDDDVHYTVGASCERAYFASARKGGNGKQDLYVARPGIIGKIPNMVLLKGLTQVNNKPVSATIKVINVSKDEVYGIYSSYASTGSYMLTLPAGFEYQLDFEIKGKVTHSEKVNTKAVETFVQVEVAVDISPGKDKKTDTTSVIQPLLVAEIQKMEALRPKVITTAQEDEKPLALPDCTLVVVPEPHPDEKFTAPGEEKKQTEAETGEKADDEVKAKEEIKQQEADAVRNKAITDSIAKVKADEQARKASILVKLRADSIAEARAKSRRDSLEQSKVKAEAKEWQQQEAALAAEATAKAAALRAKMHTDSVAKAEVEAKAKAEEKKRQEAEEKKQQEAVAAAVRTKMQEDSIAKAKAEAEVKAKDEEERKRQKAEEKKQQEAVAAAVRTKMQADSIAKVNAEAKAKAEEKKRQEAEEKNKQEAVAAAVRAKIQADSTAKTVAEAKAEAKDKEKVSTGTLVTSKEKKKPDTEKSVTATGIFFKVQVGAYPEKRILSFEGQKKKIADLGSIDSWTIDNLVRFTIGYFPSLRDATAMQSSIRIRGITDAFITAEVNGERKYLCEIYGQYGNLFEGVKIPFSPKGSSCQPVSTSVKTAPRATIATSSYEEILSSFGSSRIENLSFSIQVFATKAPSKYDYSFLNEFGKVSAKRFGDGLTRFALGNFSTLNEAEQFRKKIQAKGSADAFITASYYGKRLLLTDLASAEFDPGKVSKYL
ncbi:MAG: PD40 domain-containing protein [Bacteroidetes bacterium]|nr:PD40 domain-containing protein [Bacteroidota bacterium]